MRKQFLRTILMIAGVLTVVVILLSQSFFLPIENDLAQAKKNQKTEQQPGTTITHAPADVVPSPSIHLDESTPATENPVTPEEKTDAPFARITKIVTSYFQVLFRAIISPNAP